MSKSAKSVFVFSIYMFCLGSILVVAPNILLKLFFVPETNEVWIRVVGMLVLILGYYYNQVARNGIKQFLQWTVYGRASVLVFFVVFVLLDLAPSTLILFGIVDVAAALWTHLCLRSEKTGRNKYRV